MLVEMMSSQFGCSFGELALQRSWRTSHSRIRSRERSVLTCRALLHDWQGHHVFAACRLMIVCLARAEAVTVNFFEHIDVIALGAFFWRTTRP